MLGLHILSCGIRRMWFEWQIPLAIVSIAVSRRVLGYNSKQPWCTKYEYDGTQTVPLNNFRWYVKSSGRALTNDYALLSLNNIRLNPFPRVANHAKILLNDLHQDTMIDRIKSSIKVKQYEQRNLFIVHTSKDITLYFKNCFCRMELVVGRLVIWQWSIGNTVGK